MPKSTKKTSVVKGTGAASWRVAAVVVAVLLAACGQRGSLVALRPAAAASANAALPLNAPLPPPEPLEAPVPGTAPR